jgi:hypothetical protein
VNEEPVDLRALRTPAPLAPHDYAAVRARVMSEIRSRNRTRWRLLLPLAAALLLTFVLVRREPPPADTTVSVPVAVERPVIAEAPPIVEPAPTQATTEAASPIRNASHRTIPSASAEPIRIHIQTADPEVRIIWIVKENS